MCLTAEEVMDFYLGNYFYITIAKLGMVHVSILKHQNVGDVVIVPQEMIYFKDEHFRTTLVRKRLK